MHSIGGAERVVTDMALGFANEGTKVDIVTGVCNKIWRDQLSEKKDMILIKEVGLEAPGSFEFWFNVHAFVKNLGRMINKKTSTVITSSFPSNFVRNYFPEEVDIKTVHYFHEAPMVLHDKEGLETLPFFLRNFYRFMARIYGNLDLNTVRESDVILANSYLTKRINAKVYHLDQSMIKVVYPGVNLKSVKHSEMVPVFLYDVIQKGIPIIFFPKGTMLWWNQKICLEALLKIRNVNFVSFFTGGTNPEKRSLIKRAKKFGIQDKVFWIEKLSSEEMNSMYSRSSIVVSIPKRQPFGLIPLESLICGTPPVISASSGVSEVLQDGKEVMCVNERESDDLADALELLLIDTDLNKNLVDCGRKKVMENFTTTKFIKNIKEFI